MNDFTDITVNKVAEEPKKHTIKKLELQQPKFLDDAFETSQDFAQDWAKLSNYVLGIINSVDTLNSAFRQMEMENLMIDKDDFIKEVSMLYQIKSFHHIVNSLNFTKSQTALIMENYINSVFKVDSKKKFDLKDLQQFFDTLSGKK